MPKIYLGYSKPLDDTDLDIKQANLILHWLADPGWPITVPVRDNGTCKGHQRKGCRAAYRQTSHRLVKLPLGSS
jgi:hypothetical protein